MSVSAPPAPDKPGSAQRAGRAARCLPYAAGALAVAALLDTWIEARIVTLLTRAICVLVLSLALASAVVELGRWVRAALDPAAGWIRRRGGVILAPIGRAVMALPRRLDRRLGEPLGTLVQRLRTRPENELRGLRWVTWLGIVLLTVGLLLGAILVVTDVLGSRLAGRTTPISVEWLYIGAGLSAAVLLLVVAFLVWSLDAVVLRRHLPARVVITPGVIVVLLAMMLLSSSPVPGELSYQDKEGMRRSGSVHDVLLVVDPADPAAQELAKFVAANLWTLSRRRSDTVPYDVAFGVVRPTDRALPVRASAWSFVEPPTSVRRHFLESVAALAPAKPPPATGAYSSLFSGLRASVDVTWRDGARRTVALVLSELPSEPALDRRNVPHGQDVPSWRALVAMAATDRASVPPPERYTRVVVLTQERRRARLALWRDYVDQIGGRIIPFDRVDERVLRDLEDVSTGALPSGLRALAQRFSPYLRFDSGEQFFPVEVDQLLAKSGPDGGHEVCRHVRLDDSCRPVTSYKDLLDPYDEYIDFEGGARLGRDLVDRDNRLRLRRRIYVQAVEDEPAGRVHLVYWWFMRYNVSPVEPERNCLPGFTVSETTCFDHEGDWEGVTVTLAREGAPDPLTPYAPEGWRPESVSFASHSAVTRWSWKALDVEETHPLVYVALGSHAAYPVRCTARTCDQRLAGIGLPEGRFDGRLDWQHDATACCLPLPVTPEGRGAMWNAFRGRWGKAQCTLFIKICSQSDGPRSPSFQRRFGAPVGTTFRDQARVLADYRKRYGTSATAQDVARAPSTG